MAARPSSISVFAIVAFVAGLLLARMIFVAQDTPPHTQQATLFPSARPIPGLALVDQDGTPLDEDFFEQGWTLVFFGFTSCPDICPTTLATLARMQLQLQELPPAQRPRVLMISVDPQRDDPKTLRSYVRFFDETFIGATGTEEAIRQAAGSFSVPYARVELPDGGYTMDHGSGIFVVSPSGHIVAYSAAPHDAATLASDYLAIVSYLEHR
jgi:protein SCO1